MSASPDPPAGFRARERDGVRVIVREDLDAPVAREGLDDPGRLAGMTEGGAPGAGRGALARIALTGSPSLVLKRMRRGGMAGPLWGDRFPGLRRLFANLEIPIEARRRGIATPAPVLLVAAPGPPGLWRAWLGVEQVEGGRDLDHRLRNGPPVTREEIAAVIELVRRMHDAGIDHRDLNLGNLLLRRGDTGRPEALVVDLDRAVAREGPLPFRARQRALRRLERSYVKRFGESGPLAGEGPAAWHRLYAGADVELARRLERGRPLGRVLLALHRLGWR